MTERRLVVMRHATAVSGAGVPDHARPLTASGTAEAEATARALLAAGWRPELALVSDAARTTETWWCMAPLLGDPPMTEVSALYGGGIEAIQAVVQRVGPEVGRVLVLGHNPGWSDAIGWLTGRQVRLAPAQAALLVGVGERWAHALGPRALRLASVLDPHAG